jgi:hypothetical protein
MFNLKQGTTDKLQLITSTAATIKSLWSFTDVDTTTLNPSALDRQEAAISSATTTDIVATPASGKVRNVKDGFVYNADASLSDDVMLQLNVAATLYPIFKCTILPGESLVFWEGHLYHYNASGGVYGAPALVPDVQTFTASGANTWTKPTTFSPKTITVKLWGGWWRGRGWGFARYRSGRARRGWRRWWGLPRRTLCSHRYRRNGHGDHRGWRDCGGPWRSRSSGRRRRHRWQHDLWLYPHRIWWWRGTRRSDQCGGWWRRRGRG